MTQFQTSKITPIGLTLRAEGGAIAALCLLIYAQMGGGLWQFVVLLLAPDLFMIGYLAGNRIGATCYNIGHSYLTPLVLAGVCRLIELENGMLVALIWGAHIGLDRAIGFGLKYQAGFKQTHLNRV